VRGEWKTTENNREARYYRLTPAGRAALNQEMKDWQAFADAVALVLLAEA
jgi:PadR family transcriptional regulator, regulatory protein PadR